MKTCIKCGRSFAEDNFYRHPYMASGRLNECKECTKIRVSARYRETREDRQAYERKRRSTGGRRGAQLEYQRAMREKHPEKFSARLKLSRAVKSGKVVPSPCEVCGEPKVQAHHDDYSKPLTVRWLCFQHHLEAHGKVAIGDSPSKVASYHQAGGTR